MKMNRTVRFLFCLLWVASWTIADPPLARGARVAGDEGVTPTSRETPKKAQPPVRATPPPKRPVRRQPAGAPKKADQNQTVPEGEKSPTASKKKARFVTIDFDDVDITLFIKFISELTGKNFVIDKSVKGKVNIISPTKISMKEAYKVFESVLEVHGYTTVPAGSIIKIVPAIQARSKNIETRLKVEAITPEDKVVTQLIPLRYAAPNDVRKLFAPLISKSSVMVSYAPTGMLIVTDVLSNIKRMLEIIKAIDVEGIGEEILVVPLEHATADVMAKSLNSVFQRRAGRPKKGAPAGVGALIKIVPVERTNVLIILASEDDAFRIKQLINLLDKEIPKAEGDIHVYYLQNANAEDLSKVLMAIPTKQAKAPKKGRAPVISREIQVVADKATNSLVITAKKDDYLVLENVIQKLDIARRMVYIEALLMEVSVDKALDIGVQWQVVDEIGSHEGRRVGAFAASIPPSPISAGGIPSGFALGVLGDTISIGGIEFSSLQAVIRYLRTDSDVHILSTPQIMTTDNEEAEIIVAENRPFLTRVETTGDTTGREFSNFEFKDVGVTLKITPQINQERFVRLKISQEVSQVIEEAEVGLPITLKRTAKTTVIIKDGHTVVIGGLIDETLTRTNYKVPCLGNIPGLGWLFKSVSRRDDRTNLYIFLTPHIIENPMEAKRVYEKKKEAIDKIREGTIKMYKNPLEKFISD